jgi:hypothetical protein
MIVILPGIEVSCPLSSRKPQPWAAEGVKELISALLGKCPPLKLGTKIEFLFNFFTAEGNWGELPQPERNLGSPISAGEEGFCPQRWVSSRGEPAHPSRQKLKQSAVQFFADQVKPNARYIPLTQNSTVARLGRR